MLEEEEQSFYFLKLHLCFLFTLPFNFHFYWSRFWFHCVASPFAVCNELPRISLSLREQRKCGKRSAMESEQPMQKECEHKHTYVALSHLWLDGSMARSGRICCLAAALMFIDLKQQQQIKTTNKLPQTLSAACTATSLSLSPAPDTLHASLY